MKIAVPVGAGARAFLVPRARSENWCRRPAGTTECRPGDAREHAGEILDRPGRPPTERLTRRSRMRVVYERCCGLDVHKRSVVASVRTPEGPRTRTFGTMTAELLQLGDWLLEQRVSHVAM